MTLIDNLISEYSNSLSTNGIIFRNNRKLKILFNTVFILFLLTCILLTVAMIYYQFSELILFTSMLPIGLLYFVILQSIKNRAIRLTFPKIKTKLFKFIYPEISYEVEKNTANFISKNNLDSKLSEVSELLEKKLDSSKNQNILIYATIGIILITFLNNFLSSIFERLKDLTISSFIGISILLLLVIIGLGIGLVFLRKFLDDFSTEYDKINSIKNYIDDYRLKK